MSTPAINASLQAQRLLEISRAVLRAQNVDSILVELLEAAREMTGARFAALGVLDDRRRRFERFLSAGIDAETAAALGPVPVGHGVFGTVIAALEPVRLRDLAAHPDSSGFPPGHPAMSSFLGVPVLIEGRAWGTLYCAEQHDGAFTSEHEQLLSLLGGWAAIAIENAEQTDRSERRRLALEQALRAHRATRDVAQAIGSDLELEHVLELIVERGRTLVAANVLLILLRDEDRLVVAAAAGHPEPSPGAALNVSAPLWGAASGGERTELRERLEPSERDAWAKVGIKGAESSLLVPMLYRGELVGMLAAFRDASPAGGPAATFTDVERELLETYAASAATRVTISRSVQRDRLRDAVGAADAERRRWARELHDDTLQGLAGLRLLLCSGLRSGAELDRTVRRAVNLIDDEIADLRALLAELRPAALDDLGLEAALSALVARQRLRGGPRIGLTVAQGASGADPDLLAATYRIVQECLTNAVRHANASEISVVVDGDGGLLRVSISDDGDGFDPTAPSSGLGLIGMRERVELAGGALTIESGPDGTRVAVTLGPRA